MDNKTYRARKHCLVLYPEDKTHLRALEIIQLQFEYTAILHDKDKDEKGKIKKSHYHVVIQTKNDTWNSSLKKQLELSDKFMIQKVRSMDGVLGYLLHINEEMKHQYDFKEVIGSPSMIKKLELLLKKDDLTEGEKVCELIEFIDNSDKIISMSSFAKYCAKNGRWDIFRRSGSIFMKIIEEKNKMLAKQQKKEEDEFYHVPTKNKKRSCKKTQTVFPLD